MPCSFPVAPNDQDHALALALLGAAERYRDAAPGYPGGLLSRYAIDIADGRIRHGVRLEPTVWIEPPRSAHETMEREREKHDLQEAQRQHSRTVGKGLDSLRPADLGIRLSIHCQIGFSGRFSKMILEHDGAWCDVAHLPDPPSALARAVAFARCGIPAPAPAMPDVTNGWAYKIGFPQDPEGNADGTAPIDRAEEGALFHLWKAAWRSWIRNGEILGATIEAQRTPMRRADERFGLERVLSILNPAHDGHRLIASMLTRAEPTAAPERPRFLAIGEPVPPSPASLRADRRRRRKRAST